MHGQFTETTCACGCGGPLDTSAGRKQKRFLPNHHQRLRMRAPLEERFYCLVHKTDSCWLWTGFKNRKGYGHFNAGHEGLAHRVSWELAHGQRVPVGMHVLHDCPGGDNPSCVNPAHLRLGTNLENQQDAVQKGQTARGERSARARLTAQAVAEIRRRYAAGGISQTQLAAEFGVGSSCISRLVRGLGWSHIPIH
jgi:hypothetical protein